MMRLKARIARLETALPKPTRDSEVSQAELRERSEQLLLSLNRLQAEWQRRETLPLEDQLALQRQDLAQMRFKQRNAPIELSGHEPGGLYERWQAHSVRLLEIQILDREGVDADTTRELRDNAYAFLRFGKPLASLPEHVPVDGNEQLGERTATR